MSSLSFATIDTSEDLIPLPTLFQEEDTTTTTTTTFSDPTPTSDPAPLSEPMTESTPVPVPVPVTVTIPFPTNLTPIASASPSVTALTVDNLRVGPSGVFGPSNVANMTEAFTWIYENKRWGNDKNPIYSGSSGNGSSVEFNLAYVEGLRQFILDKGIHTVVDLGCGSFLIGDPLFTPELNHVMYRGIDCYEKVITYNRDHWTSRRYLTYFDCFDFYNQMDRIPNADLIIIKDVFQHWPKGCIQNLLNYLIGHKKAKYILVANCGYQEEETSDILLGRFHPLNSNFKPLKLYGFTELMRYNSKQVSFLKVH